MNPKILRSIQNLIQVACDKQAISSVPKIVLGFSGGPDSMFLLHALAGLQKAGCIQVIAAHLDHQWRVDSHKDVDFCGQACQKLGVGFVAAKAQDLSLKVKFNGSKEELGRRLRRAFFQKILSEHQANFIALAHHTQDQQETFLMRLIRGATLSGLCCMKMIDGQYLRPLLEINKSEMLAFLDENRIEYLTDPTNISDDYLRNRIRKYAITALNQCDSRFNKKFEDTVAQLRLENEFLEKLTLKTFETIFKIDSNLDALIGDLDIFRHLDAVLQRRTLIHWLIQEKVKFSPSQAYLDEILKFIKSEAGGNHQISSDHAIYKKRGQFRLKKA